MELLLAIGVMGLMLGMIMPRVGSVRSSYFATEASVGLATSVREARIAAIRGRTVVAIALAPGSRDRLERRQLPPRSWGDEGSLGRAAGGSDWRDIWAAPVVRHDDVSGHLEVVSPGPGIVFFPNGTSTGGEILVRDENGRLMHHFLVDPLTSALFTQR